MALLFATGAALGINHLAWWQTLPSHAPVSPVKTLGWPTALAEGARLNRGYGRANYR